MQDDGSPVSVFEFNANTPSKRNQLPLAKNALRKLRTIRHPDVLKFLDGVETDTTVHIMTERVRPLSTALQEASVKSAREQEDWVLWGLHRVSVRCELMCSRAQLTQPCLADSTRLRQRVLRIHTWERMYQFGIHLAIWRVEIRRIRSFEQS